MVDARPEAENLKVAVRFPLPLVYKFTILPSEARAKFPTPPDEVPVLIVIEVARDSAACDGRLKLTLIVNKVRHFSQVSFTELR